MDRQLYATEGSTVKYAADYLLLLKKDSLYYL